MSRAPATPTFEWALPHSRTLAEGATAIGPDAARAVWDAITGREVDNLVGEAAFLSMPDELAAVVRRRSGTPAACFVKCAGQALQSRRAARPSGVSSLGFTGRETRAWMRDAWLLFAQHAKAAETIAHGYGWDLSDAWEVEMRPRPAHVHERVLKIAKLAGRMYEVLTGVRRRVDDATPQEVKEVTIGGDLERLLASEHAQIACAVPELSMLASMRLLQRKAMQLRVAGDKPAGRGPLVIAVDESSSMSDSDYKYDAGASAPVNHAPNTWAKACMVALTWIAHEENRMVTCVHFSTTAAVTVMRPGDHEAVIAASLSFLCGGTKVGGGLRAGREQQKQLAKDGYKGADVVVITDGQTEDQQVCEAEIEAMRKDGVRLWTLGIGIDFREDQALRRDAAHYVHVGGSDDSIEASKKVRGIAAAAMGDKVR